MRGMGLRRTTRRPSTRLTKGTSKDSKITQELLEKITAELGDVSHGWMANISAELKDVPWPSKEERDQSGADRFLLYAVELIKCMGDRAPTEDRAAQWRNWTRSLGVTAWKYMEFKDASGKLIYAPGPLLEMEEVKLTPDQRAAVRNPDLYTVFTTPPHLDPAGQAVTRADFEAMMKMQAETLAAFSGRLDSLESTKVLPDARSSMVGAGSGLEDLERRMAAFSMAASGSTVPVKDAPPKGFAAGIEHEAPLAVAAQMAEDAAAAARKKSGGNDASDAESRKKTIDLNALKLQYRRIEYLNRSPLDAILRCAKEIDDFEDWPFKGTAAETRVAPMYYPQVYQGNRRGVQYAKEWIAAHRLEKCNLANQMVLHMMQADTALLYDNYNILNSASFEILARRCYGLERAYELCRAQDDWSDAKRGKVRLHLLDEYDLCSIMATGTRVPSADQEVKREMEIRAQFNKYLHKSSETNTEKA